jgi:uncharacterized protein with HEPN domain
MSERECRFYIDDMLRFAEKVRTYFGKSSGP